MRCHPTILPTQPDSRFKWCRSQTAPATHQDQGDEDLRTRSSAPGAVRRPRKSSSSAGRVHKLGMSRASGYPKGRHHLLAHGRRADGSQDEMGRDRSTHISWFLQHPYWLPSRPGSSCEGLFGVEVHMVAHHVVRGSRKLVSERPNGDDAVGLRPFALVELLSFGVVPDSMMCGL